MDIEQAKRDWELNRLKEQREEEERKAELEEDDMLYTFMIEDGMNQVVKKRPYNKSIKEKKHSPVVEPSRKSTRPPRPKQLDLPEPDVHMAMAVKPAVKRGRGRPRKHPLPTIAPDRSKLISVRTVSSPELVTISNRPASQAQYIISQSGDCSVQTNGVRRRISRPQSDISDIDDI